MSFTSEFDDILTLLSLSIFADKKVYAVEIKTLVQAATKIPLINGSQEFLSEAKVLSWYEIHKDEIREKMDLPRSEFDAWLIPILTRVKGTSDKETLSHLMEMIAVADGEVHVSERALIKLIDQNWM